MILVCHRTLTEQVRRVAIKKQETIFNYKRVVNTGRSADRIITFLFCCCCFFVCAVLLFCIFEDSKKRVVCRSPATDLSYHNIIYKYILIRISIKAKTKPLSRAPHTKNVWMGQTKDGWFLREIHTLLLLSLKLIKSIQTTADGRINLRTRSEISGVYKSWRYLLSTPVRDIIILLRCCHSHLGPQFRSA